MKHSLFALLRAADVHSVNCVSVDSIAESDNFFAGPARPLIRLTTSGEDDYYFEEGQVELAKDGGIVARTVVEDGTGEDVLLVLMELQPLKGVRQPAKPPAAAIGTHQAYINSMREKLGQCDHHFMLKLGNDKGVYSNWLSIDAKKMAEITKILERENVFEGD